jgi:hypothetical protein
MICLYSSAYNFELQTLRCKSPIASHIQGMKLNFRHDKDTIIKRKRKKILTKYHPQKEMR